MFGQQQQPAAADEVDRMQTRTRAPNDPAAADIQHQMLRSAVR